MLAHLECPRGQTQALHRHWLVLVLLVLYRHWLVLVLLAREVMVSRVVDANACAGVASWVLHRQQLVL